MNCHDYSIIAGHPKCGTSYLWTILNTHPKIEMAHINKEYCDIEFTTMRQSNYLTLNACISADKTVERHKCFGSPNNTKFIYSIG